jgi:hypothetical protein
MSCDRGELPSTKVILRLNDDETMTARSLLDLPFRFGIRVVSGLASARVMHKSDFRHLADTLLPRAQIITIGY